VTKKRSKGQGPTFQHLYQTGSPHFVNPALAVFGTKVNTFEMLKNIIFYRFFADNLKLIYFTKKFLCNNLKSLKIFLKVLELCAGHFE